MTPSFSTILSTVQDLESIFNRVRYKLLNNPTEASAKLGEVLGELGHILEFLEKESVKYLSIYFMDDKSNFIECRSALLSLESGFVTIMGYEARGHCHKIGNIYDKYLDRWFSKVLDADEAQEVRWIFERINSADDDMIEGIKEITHWLKDESEVILTLVDDHKLTEANEKIKTARKDIQQTRRNIVEALAEMKLLQASFIVSAQTI
ncbi:hypothetical protein [Membranihabitans marinus]|uniref:hypothetical protein n=1 Tax=Membranihabitans marinus TaxID=1227546 RepID=UPI001F237897|nr:hypothetical protein [Membranihabitans marinus]